jgi:DNA replication and repair protein RecF
LTETHKQNTEEEQFRTALTQAAAEERARRISIIGPHRDDLYFSLNNRSARAFGSQGQQRSLALAWKLAEINTIERIRGVRPLLLLDDVMSELDESRRNKLAALVGTVAQTVITTAHLDYFHPNLLARATVIAIPPASDEEETSSRTKKRPHVG